MRTTIVALAALAAGGCATITRGVHEQLQFDSEPRGAVVSTETTVPAIAPPDPTGQPQVPLPAQSVAGPSCVTPCLMQVKRAEPLRVTFRKPGYRPAVVDVSVRVAGEGVAGFAGNVIIGGVVGMGLDAVSGATLEHFPNPVIVTLEPEAPTSPRGQIAPTAAR